MLKPTIKRLTKEGEGDDGRRVRRTRFFLIQADITALNEESFPTQELVDDYLQGFAEDEDDIDGDQNRWVFTNIDAFDYPPSEYTNEDPPARIKMLLNLGRDWVNSMTDFLGKHGLTSTVGNQVMQVVRSIEFIAGVSHLVQQQTEEIHSKAAMMSEAMAQMRAHAESCPECKEAMGMIGVFEKKEEEDSGPN